VGVPQTAIDSGNVPARTLMLPLNTNASAKMSLLRLGFVKIDVEGHQCEVLEGFGEYRQIAKVILIEDGDHAEVRRWMHDAGFAGPFFVHFKGGYLSQERQPRPEDPVYVSQRFLPDLCSSRTDDTPMHFDGFLEGSSDATGVTQWQ